MRLSPPGTHFTAESTEAMRIKSLAQGENILMLRFEPATFVSKIDILITTPIVHKMVDKGLIYMVKSIGPRTEPRGTPEFTGAKAER